MNQQEFNRRADKITSWAAVVMIGVMYLHAVNWLEGRIATIDSEHKAEAAA